MVFTCLLMKLFDLGYRDDDVMWSVCCFCMNLARSSAKKRGSIVNEHVLGIHIER